MSAPTLALYVALGLALYAGTGIVRAYIATCRRVGWDPVPTTLAKRP